MTKKNVDPKKIAADISAEDRDFILSSGKQLRRSRIEIIQDEHDAIDTQLQAAEIAGDVKRKSVDREWPAAGTIVKAKNPWNGEVYDVTIVTNKRRKSGVDFMIESGRQFSSPSPLCQYLFGKRVSNGWSCISW